MCQPAQVSQCLIIKLFFFYQEPLGLLDCSMPLTLAEVPLFLPEIGG